MADKITQAFVYRPDRSGVKPATPGYTVENFASRLKGFGHRQTIAGDDAATIEFAVGSPEIIHRYITHRDIIRLDFEDGDVVEVRVESPKYEVGGSKGSTIRGFGIVEELKDHVLKRTFTSDNRVDVTFTVLAQTPAFYLQLFVDSLPDYITNGGHIGLTTKQALKKVSLSFQGDTVREAIDKLAEAIGCEFELSYNSGTDDYSLSLTNRIEHAGTRFLTTDDNGTLLDLKTAQVTDGRNYASRLIPILTDQDGDQGIGDARFNVNSTSGATITLQENPFPSDGWMIGQYVGNDEDGFFQVTDQVGAVLTTATDPVVLTQTYVRFATDAAGTPLYYLQPKTYDHGELERVVTYQGAGFANLFKEAGGDATMSTEGVMDVVAGLEIVGAPTAYGLVADEQHTRIGTLSQRIVGGENEGVQTVQLNPTGDYFSIWLACSVIEGGLFMDVIDGNGTIHPIDIDRPFTLSENPDVITLSGLKTSEVVLPIRVRILGTRAANTFLIDGLTVVESATERPWEPVMGPRGLFEAVLNELEIRGDGAYTRIESETIDAYLVSNLSHDQLRIGGIVTAQSDAYDLTTRIVSLTRDYVRKFTVQVETEKVQDDAIDLLTKVRGSVIHWPGGTGTTSKPPTISAERVEDWQNVQFNLQVLTPGSGTELPNYTIYCDHQYNAGSGTWSLIGGGAFAVWETQANAPHQAVFRRPIIRANSRVVTFYAVDNDRGVESDRFTYRVDPIPYSFAVDPDQSGQNGVINIQIRDDFGALATLETATRPSPSESYGSWIDQSAIAANGYDQGVVGTDAVIDRRREFSLNDKHPETIKIRAGFNMPDGTVAHVVDAVTIDLNHVPEVTFQIELQYNESANAFSAHLHWAGDEDTTGIEVDYAASGYTAHPGRQGVQDVSGGDTIDPGNSFTIEARGVNSNAGINGAIWSKVFTAPNEAPAVRAERIIGDITVTTANLEESSRRFTSNVRWSSDDVDMIKWHGASGDTAAFTIWIEGGDSYTITAGSFSGMVAGSTYYIYWDPDVSTTTFQVTSNLVNTIGARKLLLCVARRSVDNAAGSTCYFVPSPGTLNAVAEIAADAIKANVVRAVFLTAAQLSALAVETGALTVQDLLLMAAGGSIEDATPNYRIGSDGFEVFNTFIAGEPRANSYAILSEFDENTLLFTIHSGSGGDINIQAYDPSALLGYNPEPELNIRTEDTGTTGDGEGILRVRTNGLLKLWGGWKIEVDSDLHGADETAWYPPQQTTTERDAAGHANGAVIFNLTSGRFQGKRGDGTWGDF